MCLPHSQCHQLPFLPTLPSSCSPPFLPPSFFPLSLPYLSLSFFSFLFSAVLGVEPTGLSMLGNLTT
jgi:hypothetical protein